ncbi:MAG: VanZ family protein [Balneolaceae bacterium]|nr:VanZ family protein [Balneolaceae bacterium]
MISQINNYLSERKYLLLAGIILITVVTLLLTLMPVDNIMPSKIWTYDKLGHMVIFGGWTFLVGYYRYLKSPENLNLFTIFFAGVLFGIIIEGLQYILPLNRMADLFDVAFDALGCFIATLALYKIVDTE